MLTRLGPPLAVALLAGPILIGLAGTLLPAFGYLPALGGVEFTLAPMRELLAQPGILSSTLLSLASGVATTAVSLAVVMLFIAGWSGTRIFTRVQHLISPLLSVPHAAAAFGLAFLIAPSGMIARMISPELTGWLRPPDLLIVNDPLGLSMMAGLIVKEIPFLLLIALAALPQVDVAHTRALARLARLRPHVGLPVRHLASTLSPDPPRGFRSHRLCGVRRRCRGDPWPNRPRQPLAVRLVEWMQDPDLSTRFLGAAGAILQLLVMAAALLVWIMLRAAGCGSSRSCLYRRPAL